MAVSVTEQAVSRERPSRIPAGRFNRFCKRLIDLSGASVILFCSVPLIAAFACAIKLQDGGAIFYRRRVIGPGGEFDAFKLRSMRMNADGILKSNETLSCAFAVNFKLKNDPRVTPVGRVMRKWSIDELPQLWNVLRGEMSLVGPRMISLPELEKFGPAAWIFCCMRPGLTGYWQTEASPVQDYLHRVKMEVDYAEHWSLQQDLKILLKTPWRVLRGAGV